MKVTVQLECYAQVTLTNNLTGDVLTRYLRPGAYPEMCYRSYIDDGYHISSIDVLTYEEYLNRRVQDVVEHINDTENTRRQLRADFRVGKLTLDDYFTALNVTRELDSSDLRRLYRLMNRIYSQDLTCTVEEAVHIYNMVF